jgi:WD40 repeat protein
LGEGERIALSPDGWRLAAARMNGIAVFDLERDAPPILENRDTHAGLASGAIVALAYTPDGERLISAGREGTIRVWDAATGAPLRVLGAKEKQNYYHFMAASRDGKVAALEWSNISEVYSVDDGRLLARLESPRSSNRKSALSADGRFFAVGNTGPIDQEEARRAVVSGTESAPLFIEVWDVSSRERLRTFRGSELRLRNLWFSPDGKLLIGVDRDGGVRLWERETGVLRFRFDTGERVGRDYALAPDGRHLVSLGPVSQRARFQANPRPISEDVPVSDNEIVFWDLETGEATRRVTLPYEAARSLALTPDGRRAVTFSMSMTHYSIWDLETGAELQRIEPPRGLGMNALAMAPDGRSFAIGLNDGTILVYPMPPE